MIYVVLAIVVAVVVVGAVVFARWIHGIIDQSRERHDLIARLEATQAELVAACRERGIAIESYSPLGREPYRLRERVVGLPHPLRPEVPGDAQGPRFDQVAEVAHRGGEAVGEGRHVNDAGVASGLVHEADLVGVAAQRLLAHDVLAVFGGGEGDRQVGVRRRVSGLAVS